LVKGINSGDLAEMGLTLKLGPKKRLLSFLHNIGQSANNPDKVSLKFSRNETFNKLLYSSIISGTLRESQCIMFKPS
jgi:hypothetical protein